MWGAVSTNSQRADRKSKRKSLSQQELTAINKPEKFMVTDSDPLMAGSPGGLRSAVSGANLADVGKRNRKKEKKKFGRRKKKEGDEYDEELDQMIENLQGRVDFLESEQVMIKVKVKELSARLTTLADAVAASKKKQRFSKRIESPVKDFSSADDAKSGKSPGSRRRSGSSRDLKEAVKKDSVKKGHRRTRSRDEKESSKVRQVVNLSPFNSATCDEEYLTSVWRALKDKVRSPGTHIEHNGERFRNAFTGERFIEWCSENNVTDDEGLSKKLCDRLCSEVFLTLIEGLGNPDEFKTLAFFVRSSNARAEAKKQEAEEELESRRGDDDPLPIPTELPPCDTDGPGAPPRDESSQSSE